ncbi:MAG: hypothetical protein J7M24_01825 [Candidatus Latescibacteria bacterium]|nr:hypothetical protein [Candidatus Latescibacterota bacterium]
MKLTYAVVFAVSIILPKAASGEMIGNPGTQIGEKNLFVGIEYARGTHIYDLDTRGLDTISERVTFKVTTGLTDWLDLYIRAGGASLALGYKDNDYVYKTQNLTQKWGNSSKNFESDFSAGFGAGTRLRLLNFPDSRMRVFFQGGGFIFKTKDDIRWDLSDGSNVTKNREIKWADFYGALGIAKRTDYLDISIGVGFSEIWWEISDENLVNVGTTTTKNQIPNRDSFELRNPVFGFIGFDFVLPYEYRISVQAAVRSIDEAEFSVAISQGLEKD